jgi:hypothetical protein
MQLSNLVETHPRAPAADRAACNSLEKEQDAMLEASRVRWLRMGGGQ